MQVFRALKCLLADQCGVTAIEYGLIATLIAVAAVVAISQIGTSVSSVFSAVASDM